MKFKDILGKAAELKAAFNERRSKVLDAKVAKANKEILEQKELAQKLDTIEKAKKLKAENKKKVFDNSVLGKLKSNIKANAKKAKKKTSTKKGKNSKKYDPWNIQGGY